jgi:hypothetical protein
MFFLNIIHDVFTVQRRVQRDSIQNIQDSFLAPRVQLAPLQSGISREAWR